MKGPLATEPERYRLLKASAFVMALLLAVPGVDVLLRIVDIPGARGVADGGIDSRALVGTGDPFASLERIESEASPDEAPIPPVFYEEVGLLPEAHDVRASQDGTVVGYLVPGDAPEVCDALIAHMRSLGWSAVSLGEVEGATFVKAAGACTWALATCTQVGEDTSLVIRSDYS